MTKFAQARKLVVGGALLCTFVQLSACEEVNDALGIGDGKTHCEAICEWAAGCHAEARPVNAEELAAECLARLREVDSSCDDAAQAAISEECGTAVEARAEEMICSPFTGNAIEREAGALELPVECAPLGTDAIDEASAVTEEPGDSLCDRLNDSICDRASECLGELVPQEVIDAAGDLKTICLDTIADLAQRCKDEELYEASMSISEPNPTREFAVSCAADFAELECAEVFSGMLPVSCAGAFTSAESATELAGGLLSFGCGIDAASLPSCPEE